MPPTVVARTLPPGRGTDRARPVLIHGQARPPDRIGQDDQSCPVAKQDLEADLVDQLTHARHDVGRIDGEAPGVFDRLVRQARPGSFEHGVADEGDGLWSVEREPGVAVAAGQFGRGEDHESLGFPLGQSHGRHRSDPGHDRRLRRGGAA